MNENIGKWIESSYLRSFQWVLNKVNNRQSFFRSQNNYWLKIRQWCEKERNWPRSRSFRFVSRQDGTVIVVLSDCHGSGRCKWRHFDVVIATRGWETGAGTVQGSARPCGTRGHVLQYRIGVTLVQLKANRCAWEMYHTRSAKTWTAVSMSHQQDLSDHTNERTPKGFEPSTSCKSR